MAKDVKYIGNGKEINGSYGPFVKVSVCLDDVSEVVKGKDGKAFLRIDNVEGINVGKNGKYYLNSLLNKLKEATQFSTHSLSIDTFVPDGAKGDDDGGDLPF